MNTEEIKTSITSNTIPVEALAMALLPLGLCIVHRDVVSEALGLVQTVEDEEGLSGDLLARLECKLTAALAGSAA
jgi:hypothetical protein